MSSAEARVWNGSAAAGLFDRRAEDDQDMVASSATTRARTPSRSRSRSQRVSQSPTRAARASSPTPEERAFAAREAVLAALSDEARERLKKFVEMGMVANGEFDTKSLLILQGLNPAMQNQVLDYVDSERLFLANSRSKSGFLVAACEKARQGSLDARGFNSKDPWKEHLLSVARPKLQAIELVHEKEWLARHGHKPARLIVDVSADKALGAASFALTIDLSSTAETIKKRLAAIGAQIPTHKMKLRAENVGFLKNTKTLAFYNLESGSKIQLFPQIRGGVARKKDQSDGFDPSLCDGVPCPNYFAI